MADRSTAERRFAEIISDEMARVSVDKAKHIKVEPSPVRISIGAGGGRKV